tara:strand:- start:142 stop:381 length:240 start_codon:yes stop_codon:yes gene_type:complete
VADECGIRPEVGILAAHTPVRLCCAQLYIMLSAAALLSTQAVAFAPAAVMRAPVVAPAAANVNMVTKSELEGAPTPHPA